MKNKGNTGADYLAAFKQLGTKAAVAAQFGVAESTVRKAIMRCREAESLNDAGYSIDLDAEDITPQEAWDAHASTFERKVAGTLSKQWRTIKRPRGPFVIFHQTDVHVDDDGAALKLIQQDIEDSRQLDAIMCHGGDLLNNWPLGGRLAKKWAEQECTMPNALKRAQYYIDLFKPDVWVQGNHEEMNPYLASMIEGWLPKGVLTDYWTVNFQVETPGADPVRAVLSHKLQKGSSWFHKLHGHLREMLEGQEADVYMDGHLHCDGVIDQTLPERGFGALGVASGGYKLTDEYARRISKSSGQIKIRGRAHWIVCQPDADPSESRCMAFKSARQAEAMLNGLQNLKAV